MRSDTIGSLIRPNALLEARSRFKQGDIGLETLTAYEDDAILEAIALQKAAGLPVVTDGEYRRTVFFDCLVRSVHGLQPTDPTGVPAFSYVWRGASATSKSMTFLACVDKLERVRSLASDEFRFLAAHAGGAVPKITLPAPSFFSRYWHPKRSLGAYPTMESYLADLIDIIRSEVNDLIALGATYIQFDAPNYGLILDPAYRARQERPLSHLLAEWTAVDNAVIERFPGVTFGLHICRGNLGGMWAAEGGYETISHVAFPRLLHRRLLMEFDDPRCGGFAPLRDVRDGAVVVLGLISTRTQEAESPQDLYEQVQAAARHIDFERIALSPQCGFASRVDSTSLSWDAQQKKLDLVAQVAGELWAD